MGTDQALGLLAVIHLGTVRTTSMSRSSREGLLRELLLAIVDDNLEVVLIEGRFGLSATVRLRALSRIYVITHRLFFVTTPKEAEAAAQFLARASLHINYRSLMAVDLGAGAQLLSARPLTLGGAMRVLTPRLALRIDPLDGDLQVFAQPHRMDVLSGFSALERS